MDFQISDADIIRELSARLAQETLENVKLRLALRRAVAMLDQCREVTE